VKQKSRTPIKLSLNNFRSHQDFSVELPATGLIKLDGRSGTGKSTLFHAILYALYGKLNNVSSWGKDQTTTEVELEGLGLAIKRTRNPNLLTCNGWTNDQAQELIDATLGMNKVEFEVSSYVKQKQQNSLLNLSPGEQLDLIYSLAFRGGNNPDFYREKIKTQLTLLSQERVAIDRKLDHYRGKQLSLTELAVFLEKQEQEFTVADPDNLDTRLRLADKVSALKSRELEHLYKQKEALYKQKDHPARKNFQNAQAFLAALPERIANCQSKLLPKDSDAPERLAELKKDLKDLQVEHVKIEAELNRQLKQWKRSESVAGLRETLDKVQVQLIDNCSFVSEYNEVEESSALNLKIDAETWLSTYESIRIATNKDNKDALSRNIALQTVMLATNTTDQSSKQTDIDSLTKKLTEHADNFREIEVLANKEQTAHKIFKEKAALYSEEELDKEFRSIDERARPAAEALRTAEQEAGNLRNDIQRHEKCQEFSSKLEKTQAELDSVLEIVDEAVSQKNQNSVMLAQTETLRNLAQKVSLEMIEGTIAEINLRAKFWIEALFEGIVVDADLKTEKKLKSKEEMSDKLNLEVSFNGNLLSKPQEQLSGGQYSRLVLAFQLALCDLYDSPLLMLDESFSGCDQETMENCIEAIKIVSERRLVIMIEHHFSAEHYDDVISLGDTTSS